VKVITDIEWIDKVLIVPLLDAPHKKNIQALPVHRLEMCQIALKEYDDVEVEDAIINENITGYDLNLVRILQNKNPNACLHYILGSDVYLNILQWREIEDLSNMVQFIVFIRDEKHLEQVKEISNQLTTKTTIIKLEKDNISSSKIRHCLKNNKPTKNSINQSILEYINKHSLYK
jgi:nicotinate-nucleotide adenylyltransferase